MRFAGWKSQLNEKRVSVAAALKEAPPSGHSANRLKKLANALGEQERLVENLLQPLQPGAASPLLQALTQGRVPFDFSLVNYETNLFRDWVWGEEENQASIDTLRSLEPKGGGELLVLGSGWGKLAYDFHEEWQPNHTVAVDLNPFCAIVAKDICSGKTVRLHEFPEAPVDLGSSCLFRELKAPKPARDGLRFVVGDVSAPPFRSGAFDTVLTPWIVDVMKEGFAAFAERVNALLRPGGQWIEFGSLAFKRANPLWNHSLEEAREIVEASGFELVKEAQPSIAYLKNPASRYSRTETVWSFKAVKKQERKMPPPFNPTASWLQNPSEPIPKRPEFQASLLTHSLYGEMLFLINGKNSVQNLAEALGTRYGLTPDQALEAVTHFLGSQKLP